MAKQACKIQRSAKKFESINIQNKHRMFLSRRQTPAVTVRKVFGLAALTNPFLAWKTRDVKFTI